MIPMATDWIQAGASTLTLGAAIVAAVIAARAPKQAAQYAERYRRETARLDEQAAFQTYIFRALMKGRSEIANVDSRAAINLVEAAFPNDAAVRTAKRLFTRAADAQPFDAERLARCYLDLIAAVANAVDLGDVIDRADIEAGYYPVGLGKLDAAALLEAEKKLAEIGHGNPKTNGERAT